MKSLIAISILLFSTNVFASSIHPGTPTLCTKDINAWGNPSYCGCASPENYEYDQKIGYCTPKVKQETKIEIGKFKMFAKPNHQSTFCDSGSQLVLNNDSHLGPIALIEDFVEGGCEIYMLPNQRYVKLELANTSSCGEKYYKGQRVGSNGQEDIEIIDYRNLRCRMMPPAPVVLKTKYANGQEQELFSKR